MSRKKTVTASADQFTAKGFMITFNNGELRIYSSAEFGKELAFVRADSGVSLPLHLKVHPKGFLSVQIISNEPCTLEASVARKKAKNTSPRKR